MAAKLEVRWTHGSDTATAPARDASLGGLFIETEKPLEDGTLLSVEIADGSEKVLMDARVILVRAKSEGIDAPAGMGVRFLDLPDESAGALRRILARRLPREETVLGIGVAVEPPPERGATIHGVGAVSREATTPGVAPPAELAKAIEEKKEEKRDAEKTLAEPAAVMKEPPPKREEPSSPKPPPPAPREEPVARVEVAPSSPKMRATEEEPPPASAKPAPRKPPPPVPKAPPPSGSNAIRWLFVVLMAGAAFGAYAFRDEIAKLAAPEPTAAPSVTPPQPSVTVTALPADNDATIMPVVEDAAIAVATDAAVAREAGAKDAGVDAAHKDAGPHDAGHREAGAHRPVEGGAGPPHP